jgi:putative transposase
VRKLCIYFDVSPSGFYAWASRKASKRKTRDEYLKNKIKESYDRSRGTYGSPRIIADLRFMGESTSRKRVQRLMQELGIMGASRRRWVTTTMRDHDSRPAPDLVKREFKADQPNKLWVADITYIPTWEGFLYLAVVLDVFSRKIVGWSMAPHLRTELVTQAMEMALAQRKPVDVIHHSDQGCQYTSIEFGLRCREAGVRPSMGTVADCFDNAMCESFFATLECEHLAKNRFKTKVEARLKVFEFIEGWYNPTRRHSALDYLSPLKYEQHYWSRTG